MKKSLFLLLLMTAFLNRNTFAQDDDLIVYVVEDGSLSLMVPEGWHVDEDLGFIPNLMMTNESDLLLLEGFPEEIDEGTYALVMLVVYNDSIDLIFPDVAMDAPFEDIASEMINAMASTSDEEYPIVIHEISIETLENDQAIALADASFGDLDAVISIHILEQGLIVSLNVGAVGDRLALRERVLQVVPTLEFISPQETTQSSFTAVGDPLLEIDVQHAAWMSDFAPVDLSREAVQSFKFRLRHPLYTGHLGAWIEFSGLALDVEPGVYDVDLLGTISAIVTVWLDEDGDGAVGLPLYGTLTIDESGTSITGSFDLHTDDNDDFVQPTAVTGNFTDVTIPDVSACILTASGATLQIEGVGLPEVDTQDAVWIIEPGILNAAASLNFYISDGDRVVALKGIDRDADLDDSDIVTGLYEVTTAEDGSRSVDVQVLTGTVLISSGNELSGEFDLMVNGQADTHISGEFSDIPIPAQSCAQASD